LIAIPRAILLRTLACSNSWLTTYWAFVRYADSKACQLLAFIGAVALSWFGTLKIKWVVFLTAVITNLSYSHPHIYIIPQKQIEEKYCEIAANRCRQMVFDLR